MRKLPNGWTMYLVCGDKGVDVRRTKSSELQSMTRVDDEAQGGRGGGGLDTHTFEVLSKCQGAAGKDVDYPFLTTKSMC